MALRQPAGMAAGVNLVTGSLSRGSNCSLRHAQVTGDFILADLFTVNSNRSAGPVGEEVDRLVRRAVLLLVAGVVHVDRDGVDGSSSG